MNRKSISERPEADIAARLTEIRMTHGERRDALHALQVGSWLADLLLASRNPVRGLRRALVKRRLERKIALRKQASRDSATRRPARA